MSDLKETDHLFKPSQFQGPIFGSEEGEVTCLRLSFQYACALALDSCSCLERPFSRISHDWQVSDC